MLVKHFNNNDPIPLKRLFELYQLNVLQNETINQVVEEMAAIAMQRLARGYLARQRYTKMNQKQKDAYDAQKKEQSKKKHAVDTITNAYKKLLSS